MTVEQMKIKYGDEKVLCIPRECYEESLGWVKNYSYPILCCDIGNDGEFKLRYEVEQDEKWLQVIPYVVVKCEDEYFITKRLGGDPRLQGMVAYVGGHVNPCDYVGAYLDMTSLNADGTLHSCVLRELEEEVGLSCTLIKNNKCVDVFVDERAPVSRVHICALVIVEIHERFKDSVQVIETDKLEGDWATLEELEQFMNSGKMEGWCEIATKKLLNLKEDK